VRQRPRFGKGLLAAALALLTAVPVLPSGENEPSTERLAQYMKRRAADGFNGVVLVAHDGVTLLREGYGLAEAELDVPNTPETIFRIGSVTKPLVATAVLRLVSRGVLDLEDRISRYIPNCPKAWEAVSVEHLLSHTSGIPDLFGRVASGPPEALRRLIDETFEKSRPGALDSEPGARYAYSNFGYLLLAYVAEGASGRPWLDVLQSEVLTPAGLTATRYDDVWSLVPGRARGYERKGGALLNSEYKDHGAFSAGGLLSTADDLQRFTAALEGGALLPPRLKERMFTPVRGDYGLGFQVTRFFDHAVRNHTGGIGGFSAHIAEYPSDRLFVAVLSNVEDEPVKAMACDLAALWFESDEIALDRNPGFSGEVAEQDLLVGTYADENGEQREILRDGNGLAYRRGGRTAPLVAVGPRRLTFQASPEVILTFDGPATEPALGLSARTCGGVAFSARRVIAR